MHRICFVLLALAAGAAEWTSKTFSEWSPDTVLRLLTDSPWSKGSSANIEWTKREQRPITYKDIPGADHANVIKDNVGLGPLGGIGAPKPKLPTKADLLIRFPNALPLRHAKAMYRLRDEKLPADRLNSLIDAPASSFYVVEIFGVPSEVAHQGTGSVEALVTRSAYLRTRHGRKYQAARTEVTPQGTTLKILVYFPNEEPLKVGDEEIEFFADIQLLKCKERFRLSAMTYMGRLEL